MPDPKGPICSCGHKFFDVIPLIEFDMTWVCCEKCGAVVASRDDILIEKLDVIIAALPQGGKR